MIVEINLVLLMGCKMDLKSLNQLYNILYFKCEWTELVNYLILKHLIAANALKLCCILAFEVRFNLILIAIVEKSALLFEGI